MSRILLTLLVLASAVAAAQEAAPSPTRARKQIAYVPRFPKDFAFLQPGKTTPDEAKAVLGDTKWAMRSYIVEKELVVNLTLADLPSLYEFAGDRDVTEVYVQVFTAGANGLKHAHLVYQDGVLLWAHYPVAESERTRAKIAASWGRAPVVYKMKGLSKDAVRSDHMLYIPGERIAYFQDMSGYEVLKIVYAEGVDATWAWTPGDMGEPRP